MPVAQRAKHLLKRILLGPDDFSQQVTLSLWEPQQEIAVWLHGAGAPRDVTYRHFMACSAPFLIGIPAERGHSPEQRSKQKLSLSFQERNGRGSLLGRIYLVHTGTVSLGDQSLLLFCSGGSQNYCLPLLRLWARYLQYAHLRRRTPNSEISMSARDVHSMCVFYICPRPTGLVTVVDKNGTNVFPMNLMGAPSDDYFCFALKTSTPVVPLVERAGRLAVSSIPVEQAPVAYRLGRNHNREFIDPSELPFPLRHSKLWQFPVPEFALRVRELQVESASNLGSHTLFVARVMHDEKYAEAAQFFLIHGMYQVWRNRAARI